MNSSYRPHDPGHDYYAPGIYLITLVVRNRERNHELLGRLNGDVKAPAVVLTEIGKAVRDCWLLIPEIQALARKLMELNDEGFIQIGDEKPSEVYRELCRAFGELNVSSKALSEALRRER